VIVAACGGDSPNQGASYPETAEVAYLESVDTISTETNEIVDAASDEAFSPIYHLSSSSTQQQARAM
jgi:hypothetical protein